MAVIAKSDVPAAMRRCSRRRDRRSSLASAERLERRDCPAAAITVANPPIPSVTISDAVVMEGNSRTTQAIFTVSLSGATTRTVSVPYSTADGTATAGNDYVAKSGTLVFSPGQRSKMLIVDVIGDQRLEIDETYSVRLSPPQNATLAKALGQGTIRNDEIEPSGFQIELAFGPNVTRQDVRVAMTQAVKRWERVIVGDLPKEVLPDGTVIDDLRVRVQIGLLDVSGETDQKGEVLANAKIFDERTGGGLPYDSVIGIDGADIPLGDASRDRLFGETLVHELGHALGFGGSKRFKNLTNGAGGFVGPDAVAEYRSVFRTNATAVPLENTGGGGSAGGHWRETVFGNELMSTESPPNPAPEPLSRITIAALQDIGYRVSFGGAERYVPSAAAIAAANALANQQAAAAVFAMPSGKRPTVAAFSRLAT